MNILGLDKLIQVQASQLFALDKLSWKVLEIFAEKGKQTIYSLYSEPIGQSQSAIRRRFKGSKKFVGLEKEAFITRYLNIKYRDYTPEPYRKYYYLEFKGFLATLRYMKLEKHPLFRVVVDAVEKYVSLDLSELFIEYVKVEIACWFQSHIENGLNLTFIKIPHLYYYQTKHTEKIFGNLASSDDPIMPDILLDPETESSIEVEGWKQTYSNTWLDLTTRKQKLHSELTERLTSFEENQQNILWRWNETMILLYWWRQREEALKGVL